jgi:broad-specificity NMP kinase
MSATGKTSVVAELRRRDCVAYDVDDGLSAVDPADGRWHWRIDGVTRLLQQGDENHVFIAGCSEEQVEFTWDMKVLLTAPQEVILDRLRTRWGNTYGRSLIEQEQVLADLARIQPLLRRTADVVIETTIPLSAVVDQILAAADGAVAGMEAATGDGPSGTRP